MLCVERYETHNVFIHLDVKASHRRSMTIINKHLNWIRLKMIISSVYNLPNQFGSFKNNQKKATKHRKLYKVLKQIVNYTN